MHPPVVNQLRSRFKEFKWDALLAGAGIAAAFGTAFWFFTEIGQPSLVTFTGGRTDCCERCTNLLFDNAQPVLAFCAGLAFIACLYIGGKVLGLRHIAKTVLASWLSFQVFSLWTAWHLFYRTECTALYSPGPIKSIGVFFVGLVLLVESSVWAGICLVPVLLIGVVRKFIEKEETIKVSLLDDSPEEVAANEK